MCLRKKDKKYAKDRTDVECPRTKVNHREYRDSSPIARVPLTKTKHHKANGHAKKISLQRSKEEKEEHNVGNKETPTKTKSPMPKCEVHLEQTCCDECDQMQISLFKDSTPKKNSAATKFGQSARSAEVFENNANVVSLYPLNVTQIFNPPDATTKTTRSSVQTDIVDQDTLQNIDPSIEDMIYAALCISEEQYPEVQQNRPQAIVLDVTEEPSMEMIVDERRSKSEKGGIGRGTRRGVTPTKCQSKTRLKNLQEPDRLKEVTAEDPSVASKRHPKPRRSSSEEAITMNEVTAEESDNSE